MFFFMLYYIANFLFQFFTVGSMYASITIFLKQEFTSIMTTTYDAEGSFLNNLFSSSFITDFFDYMYIALIVMAIIISLTTPVDRGIAYFKFLMGFFGVLLLITMGGIIYYLIE